MTTEYKIVHEYSCCSGSKVSLATRSFVDFYYPKNKSTKYELHLTSKCKVINRCALEVIDSCSCYHGNKVSIAARSFVYSYCPNKQIYRK